MKHHKRSEEYRQNVGKGLFRRAENVLDVICIKLDLREISSEDVYVSSWVQAFVNLQPNL
jgi:hypothetical protein